jgi:hypothetical protein
VSPDRAIKREVYGALPAPRGSHGACSQPKPLALASGKLVELGHGSRLPGFGL